MLKKFLIALFPSIILGFVFFLLIGLTQGMEKIGNVTGIWILVGIILFEIFLVLISKGENLWGRFFIYLAYEFWASPIFAVIYSASSVNQANTSAGSAGAVGAGIGGVLLIIIAVVIGGFGGLIFFLIGRNITKKSKKAINKVE